MTSNLSKSPLPLVDVCICTFRRLHIAETLRSLAAMAVPQGLSFRVVVADNDETDSARETVRETAAAAGLDTTYLHAPARNISIARNACLDEATAPLVAFIDDDELATPDWLAALHAAMANDVDVVLGPVQAMYPSGCPAWIRASDLHSTEPVWVDGDIITGYTCNVMFRRSAPAFAGLRFREELGRSGGEDTAFFTAAHAAGARIVFAPAAVVTEAVPASRATFSWLLKRRFRAGQTHGRLLLETARGAGRVKLAAVAVSKAAFCFISAVLPAGLGHGRRCLLRGALHAGVVARLLGRSDIEQYGIG
jgi:succinoglycan biosynthesis protein ExoM